MTSTNLLHESVSLYYTIKKHKFLYLKFLKLKDKHYPAKTELSNEITFTSWLQTCTTTNHPYTQLTFLPIGSDELHALNTLVVSSEVLRAYKRIPPTLNKTPEGIFVRVLVKDVPTLFGAFKSEDNAIAFSENYQQWQIRRDYESRKFDAEKRLIHRYYPEVFKEYPSDHIYTRQTLHRANKTWQYKAWQSLLTTLKAQGDFLYDYRLAKFAYAHQILGLAKSYCFSEDLLLSVNPFNHVYVRAKDIYYLPRRLKTHLDDYLKADQYKAPRHGSGFRVRVRNSSGKLKDCGTYKTLNQAREVYKNTKKALLLDFTSKHYTGLDPYFYQELENAFNSRP